jgi:hypothetical protein
MAVWAAFIFVYRKFSQVAGDPRSPEGCFFHPKSMRI